MFKLNKKILITTLLMAFFSVAMTLNCAKASNRIVLSNGIVMDLVPSATSVMHGESFYVNVTISGIEASDDLVGIEFRFKWNTTLLTAVRMDLPQGHIFQAAADDGNLWTIKKAVNDATNPNTAWLIVTCSSLQQGYDAGYLPITGGGVVAKVTFNATSDLVEGTSPLYWVEVLLSNGAAGKITGF